MIYCYPGRGISGDLPPRRECAQLWLDQLVAKLRLIEPSPRNTPSFQRNSGVERQLLPELCRRIAALLAS